MRIEARLQSQALDRHLLPAFCPLSNNSVSCICPLGFKARFQRAAPLCLTFPRSAKRVHGLGR